MTKSIAFGIRIVAAVAMVFLALMAVETSRSTVMATFPAAGTAALTDDLVIECKVTNSLDERPGGVIRSGVDGYNLWLELATKNGGEAPETSTLLSTACDQARDARLIRMIWLVAGALAAGLVLVAFTRIRVRES